MKRMVLASVIGLLCSVAAAEAVNVIGKVLDQTQQKPLPGVKVNLFKLTGTWKFWTLPDQELVGSAITSQSGDFVLSGDVPRYYVVEVDIEDCGAPYKRVFDVKDEGSRVDNLRIVTWVAPCRTGEQ